MRSYEAAGAVRVVEPDILAHKNTRDEYRVEDKRGRRRGCKDSIRPFQHGLPLLLVSTSIS